MTFTKNRYAVLALVFGALPLLAGGCDTDAALTPESEIDAMSDVEVAQAPSADDEFRAWSDFVSEEDPPTICPNNFAVRGVECRGDYCDNISINCRPVSSGSFGQSFWTPYFSEEGSGPADEGRCTGPRRWMTGLACMGSFCDNLSIRCTQFPDTSASDCRWSDWHSEEDGRFNAPNGFFLKNIECDGDYCDNKRYRYCRAD